MNINKYTTIKTTQGVANMLAITALLVHMINPGLAQAKTEAEIPNTHFAAMDMTITQTAQSRMFYPNVVIRKPDKRMQAVITAYTSTPDQTDDTPFIAATGKHVYDGMIAANGLPFGTIIKIPGLYGEKEFMVDDRMNSRYSLGRMDVWLDTTRAEARKFGVKRMEVEIYYPKAKQIAKK